MGKYPAIIVASICSLTLALGLSAIDNRYNFNGTFDSIDGTFIFEGVPPDEQHECSVQ